MLEANHRGGVGCLIHRLLTMLVDHSRTDGMPRFVLE
jgi:hypothetical protein